MRTSKFFENSKDPFAYSLNNRVEAFLKEKGIDKKANGKMVLKTIFLFSSFIGLYLFLLLGKSQNLYLLFPLWALLGIGQALIGITVMHDTVHGAYSGKRWINSLLEMPIIAIGVESVIWKIEHNFIHHNFTNIEEIDQDIHPRYLFRFSKHQPKKWFHRFQHIYATFIYGLLTIEWTTIKDFKKVIKYHKEGFIPKKSGAWTLAGIIFIKKCIFHSLYILIPLLVLEFDWYITILLSLTMLVTSGIVMTLVFQTAHVVPQCKFILSDNKNKKISWHRHQMETTANFATKNKVITYFLGGLNYQIEHHLFPGICHVHYPQISAIVKKTAKEFSYPYFENETLRSAIGAHFSLLKNLGRS